MTMAAGKDAILAPAFVALTWFGGCGVERSSVEDATTGAGKGDVGASDAAGAEQPGDARVPTRMGAPDDGPEIATADAGDAEPRAEYVCCDLDGACSLTSGVDCAGILLPQLNTCDPNPCGSPCATDDDCPDHGECSGDFVCGCREAPHDSCPDGQFCEPERNVCIPIPPPECTTDDDCPDPATYCEVPRGECLAGCRMPGEQGTCPDPLTCMDDHICTVCDRICPGGRVAYCHEECPPDDRPWCPDDFACEPEEFCDLADPAGAICRVGCRDDDPTGTNNSAVDATPIPIVGGYGRVDGAVVCEQNLDVYSVQLVENEQMQVVLTEAGGGGATALQLLDTDGFTVLAEDSEWGTPKLLRLPNGGGPGVGLPGLYYIVVDSRAPRALSYALDVAIVGDGAGCFPDAGEFPPEGPHDGPQSAVPIDWAGLAVESFDFDGTGCPAGDEDWFTFPAIDPNAGVTVRLVVSGGEGGDGGAVVELYDQARAVLGLGNPNETAERPAGPGPDGTLEYVVSIPAGAGRLTDAPWYLRIRGADANRLLDAYHLVVTLSPPG
jgi:hypothetical protein